MGFRISGALLAALVAGSCADIGAIQDIQPGEAPALDTDEAGLWMVMEQAEAELQTSGRVVTDPELNAYVRGIVCKLSPEQCSSIRIYVVRSPLFNASMAPNGTMHVWTGLLLRAENEAQLAYVLGHELAHYVRRHSLKRWRDARAKTSGLIFFQIATIAFGVGTVGDMAAIATLGTVFGFSRDQEREADDLGFEMIAQAGYDAREAPKVWDRMLEEKEASADPEKSIFFATHPATEERSATLAKKAVERGVVSGEVGRNRLAEIVDPYRVTWLRDEFRYRDFGRLQVVLNHQEEIGLAPGQAHYFQGKIYQQRRDDGDRLKAVEAYEAAVATGEAPPQAYSQLGLAYWNLERPADARRAFLEYLELQQEAEDKAMIEAYLRQIQGSLP